MSGVQIYRFLSSRNTDSESLRPLDRSNGGRQNETRIPVHLLRIRFSSDSRSRSDSLPSPGHRIGREALDKGQRADDVCGFTRELKEWKVVINTGGG